MAVLSIASCARSSRNDLRELEQLVSSPAPSRITVTLPANAACSGGGLFIDGVDVGHYPVEELAVAPGAHHVHVRSEGDRCGYGDLEIVLREGEHLTLDAARFRR